MRFISNPKIKETKNDKGIKYQDAEFKEIDLFIKNSYPIPPLK
jgi:hypothetical protein